MKAEPSWGNADDEDADLHEAELDEIDEFLKTYANPPSPEENLSCHLLPDPTRVAFPGPASIKEITLIYPHREAEQPQQNHQPQSQTQQAGKRQNQQEIPQQSRRQPPQQLLQQQQQQSAEHPPKKRRKGKLLLWQFLLQDLLQGHSNLSWLDDQRANPGVFMFRDPNQAARRWGGYKENDNMSYEKMSRCIRDYWIRSDNKYFKVMVPDPVKGRRLHFAYNLKHTEVLQFVQKHSPEYHHSLTEQGLVELTTG